MAHTDVHPGLRAVAHLLPHTTVSPRTLWAMRALHVVGAAVWAGRGVEAVHLGSGAGVRLFRPAGVSHATPALLWIHGGGYIAGQAKIDDRWCRRLVAALDVAVASVDYRLAPEHPYPAALEDCYAALTWLTGLSWVDPARIAIGGASAGAGLAAALALLARDRGEVTPVLQSLAYPMLDDRSAALPANRNYRLWSPNSNRFGWAAYLGDTDPRLAAPGRRDDLHGLAPAWIGVGTHDLFHDENLAYAQRLTRAGVPCHVDVVPGAFHGFDRIVPMAGVSRAFFASQCASLRVSLNPRR